MESLGFGGSVKSSGESLGLERVVGWKSVLVGIFGLWSSWWPVCGEAVRGATRSSELAVGGESGRGTRDADRRRRSASSVAQTCASE